MSSPTKNRDFRHLMAAGAISGLGDWMGTFGFMALALTTSDSSAAVGGILTLRLLPAALGGTMVTRIVAKLGRKRAMVLTDFMRAGIVAMVPFVDELWWIYIWAFLLEGTSIIFATARDSCVPDLAGKSDLPTANALVLGTSYGSIPISAGLFAGIAALPVGGLPWVFGNELALVFWIDAVTFMLSAFFITRIAGIKTPSEIQATKNGNGRAPLTKAQMAETPNLEIEAKDTQSTDEKSDIPKTSHPISLREGFKIPLIRKIIFAVASVSVGLGALFSLGIALIRDELGASDVEFGIMILLFGVGAVFGLLTTRKMGQNHLSNTRIGALGMGAIVGVMSLSPYLWGTFLGALGFGLGATVALVAGMSALQSSLPEEERVLAFAIFHIVIRIGLGIAAVVTGVLGDALGDVPVGWDRSLAGTRLVLLASGVLVFLTAWFTKTSFHEASGGGQVQKKAGRRKHKKTGAQNRK